MSCMGMCSGLCAGLSGWGPQKVVGVGCFCADALVCLRALGVAFGHGASVISIMPFELPKQAGRRSACGRLGAGEVRMPAHVASLGELWCR